MEAESSSSSVSSSSAFGGVVVVVGGGKRRRANDNLDVHRPLRVGLHGDCAVRLGKRDDFDDDALNRGAFGQQQQQQQQQQQRFGRRRDGCAERTLGGTARGEEAARKRNRERRLEER